MGLYQTVVLTARACGVDWLAAILDMPVFRLLQWTLRMPFAAYEGVAPLPYLGSAASIPAWCNLVDYEKRLVATDPDLHALLFEGLGLESAVRRVDLSCIDRLVA